MFLDRCAIKCYIRVGSEAGYSLVSQAFDQFQARLQAAGLLAIMAA